MPSYFQFQPYRSDAPQTIADLMVRSGDQQAAALRASGEAKARGIAQIGQDAAGTIANIQQERRDAPVRALQLQNLQNETALGDAKVAAVRRAKIGQDVLATAVQRFGDDAEKVVKFVSANGFSELADGYLQTHDLLGKLRKGAIADQDSANAFEGEILSRIAKLPTPDAKQAAWTAAQGALKAHKIDTSALSPTWDDAQAAAQIALYGPKPELMNVPAGGAVVDKNNPTAPVFTAPPRETPVSLQSVNRLVNGKPMSVNFNPRTGKYTDQAGAELQNVQPIPPASSSTSGADFSNVKEAVAGMKDGTIPPQLPGRASKEYTAMMAEAHRQGYDLAGAATDWMATQKHIATMNGSQQLRLNQAINALPEMLDKADQLAAKWKGGKFPPFNRANLALAKNGAFGPEVASVANQLEAQVADITADLGNVYMGGNSPTDHALSLAGKSLKGEWDAKVFHDMVQLAKTNVQIRKNSINNTGVQGASGDNPYMPPAPAAAPASTQSAGRVTVDGFTFPNQAAADAYKKEMGK